MLRHLESQSRRLVVQQPAGLHFVHILSARATTPAAIFLDIFRIDFNLHIRHFRQDRHGGRAGVNSPLGFGFGHALHTIGAAAPYVDDHFLESAAIA